MPSSACCLRSSYVFRKLCPACLSTPTSAKHRRLHRVTPASNRTLVFQIVRASPSAALQPQSGKYHLIWSPGSGEPASGCCGATGCGEQNLGADDEVQAVFLGCEMPTYYARDRAFNGRRQGAVHLGRSPLHQILGLRGAGQEGEVRAAVQLRKGWRFVWLGGYNSVHTYSIPNYALKRAAVTQNRSRQPSLRARAAAARRSCMATGGTMSYPLLASNATVGQGAHAKCSSRGTR